MPRPKKPKWHSSQSWKIEALKWETDPKDFEALCGAIIQKLTAESEERGQDLTSLVTLDELRKEIRIAASNYSARAKKLIGLETHLRLWMRAFIGTKRQGKSWR